MLYIYNITPQELDVGESIAFPVTGVQTDCVAMRTANDTAVINRPGFFVIHFNASVSATDAAGDITVQLAANGIDIDGATATVSSTGVDDIVNISLTAIARVQYNFRCNTGNVPATITVINTGVAATYADAALTIA